MTEPDYEFIADHYEKALIHIEEHMEIVMKGKPELSAVWNIANNSLLEIEKYFKRLNNED